MERSVARRAAPRPVGGGAMSPVWDFVANTSEGAFAVDRSRTIVLWNKPAAQIVGVPAQLALGRKCFTVMRGCDPAGRPWCGPECPIFSSATRLEPHGTTQIAIERPERGRISLSLSTILVPSKRCELCVLLHLFREVANEQAILRTVTEFARALDGLSGHFPHCDGAVPPPAGDPSHLTQREREVLAHLAAGEKSSTIAERLFISVRTVDNHVTAILSKLHVHSRLEAVAWFIHNGNAAVPGIFTLRK